MSRDPFDALAVAIMNKAASSVPRTRHIRVRVTGVDPLEAASLDGSVQITEDDDDVELSKAITDAVDGGDLVEGDLLDVREDEDGYFVQGVYS